MKSEVEKQSEKERAKRKYAEKVRMNVKTWTEVEVARLVSEWCDGTLNDSYLEYTTLWKWLGIRAGKEDKDILKLQTTKGGIRLSLEYLKRVHDDVMTSHTAKNLREKCDVKMDDYLIWSESEIATFVFRCEQLIEADRIERQMHKVRKKMEEEIDKGNTKVMDQFLKMTGRDKSELREKEGFTMQVVEKYHVDGQDQTGIPKKN